MIRTLIIWLILGFTAPQVSLAQRTSLKGIQEKEGALIRSDSTQKTIYLMFTAHEFGEGIPFILETFDTYHIKGSFFLTGDFIRNNRSLVTLLHKKGHYVGPHSDKHLLYCDWGNRDSLLISMDSFKNDLHANISELVEIGIPKKEIRFFMPPYEWYNKRISEMVSAEGLKLINFTPGTSSNVDYTTPDMPNYVSSDSIYNRIIRYESIHSSGLNGFHLLIHAGMDPKRTDKLYARLAELINLLQHKGYTFSKINN